MMREIWLSLCARALLATGLAATFLSMIWACVSHRPLFADTAGWYTVVLNSGETFVTGPTFRYADRILQLPGVVLLAVSGKFFPSYDATSLFIHVQNVCYVFHPLLSLLCCFWLLRLKKRPELIVFPVMSFAAATQCTVAFVAGIAPLTLSMFWPALILSMLRDPRSRIENAALVALAILLALSYETVLVLFLLLGASEIFRAVKAGKAAGASRWLMSGVFVLCLFFAAFRIADPFGSLGAGGSGRFWDSVQMYFNQSAAWVYGGMAAVFSVLTVVTRPSKAPKLLPWVAVLGGAAAIVILGCLGYRALLIGQGETLPYASAWTSFQGRVMAVPYAFAIGAACLWCERFLSPQYLRNPRVHHSLAILAGAALLVALGLDLGITAQWRQGVREIRAILAEKPGCVELPQAEYDRRIGRYGLADYSVPQISFLLHGSRKIHSVVIPGNHQRRRPGEALCESVKLGYMPQINSEAVPFSDFGGYFDYSELVAKGNR